MTWLTLRQLCVALLVFGLTGGAVPAADTSGPSKSELDKKQDPAFEQWIKSVAKMSPEEQVKAVTAKLRERNPDLKLLKEKNPDLEREFLTHEIKNGKVTNVYLSTDDVSDISPLRALPHLSVLKI